MSIEHREELARYLVETARKHKFPQIDEEATSRIIIEERKFLPIIYRTFDRAQRSIDRIVLKEFNDIEDPVAKTCVSICSLSSSMDLDIPIAVLKNALSDIIGEPISYSDIYEKIGIAKEFIKTFEDPRSNPLASIYHSEIAKLLVGQLGKSQMDKFLVSIGKAVDIRSKIEADFIRKILIERGVNRESRDIKPFTDDGLETAFLEIKNRQPARPILHHLARFYAKKDPQQDDIIQLLDMALAEPQEEYAMRERKENILTTYANLLWKRKKDDLISRPINDSELQEIFDFLNKAKRSPSSNVHAFHIHARILKTLSESRDYEEKTVFVNKAIEVISEGLDCCQEDLTGQEDLNTLLIEMLSELDEDKSKEAADSLFVNQGDGTGYYTLARLEYHHKHDYKKAREYSDKALKAKMYSPNAIAFRIEIELENEDKTPDYFELEELADRLSQDTKFKDTWKSAYHKGVIYTINGRYRDAKNEFEFSRRHVPRTLERKIQIFWKGMVRRKIHEGKINPREFTERQGFITSHKIKGWESDIFFNPKDQEKKGSLGQGLWVEFELGFSPRGPIAFDVRLRVR